MTRQLPHGVSLDEAEARARLELAAARIGALPQTEIPLRHYFAQGVYGREGVIPAGTLFTGRVHLQSQINVLLKGRVTVLSEEGVFNVEAPFTWAAKAGAQRAAYVHEDALWLTLLGTEETDPELIYDTLTAASYEDFQKLVAELQNSAED